MKKSKKIIIYSDASFSKEHKLAVIGFAKGTTPESELKDLKLTLETIKEENNVRAELKAAILGLKSCPEGSNVILYSDSHAVTDLSERRKNLEKKRFISKNTGLALNNSDLYKEFFLTIDRLRAEIKWVKGHSPQKELDLISLNFSYIDKLVRKSLRSELERI